MINFLHDGWYRKCRDSGVKQPGSSEVQAVTLFLCGDVMTGRGVDQILGHPSDAALHEPYVESAFEYLAMAETANGPIPKPVDSSYIWGEAADELIRSAPAARIINLENSITSSDNYEAKGINYRMHPSNVECLTADRMHTSLLVSWRRAHVMIDCGTDWTKPVVKITWRFSRYRDGARRGISASDRDLDLSPALKRLPSGQHIPRSEDQNSTFIKRGYRFLAARVALITFLQLPVPTSWPKVHVPDST